MNTTKKMLAVLLFALAVFGFAFAQQIRIEPQSMTSLSTAGLDTTDVDDFLNVNEYHNVMPEKFFAFLGYGANGSGDVQFGFAKQLKAVYLGAFFGGKPLVWDSQTVTDNDGKKTITTKTTAANASTAAVLVGFKNMGVLASFTFKPNANNDHTINEAAKTERIRNNFEMDTGIVFGMNINGPKDRLFKTYGELALVSTVNKTTNKANGDVSSITDASSFLLAVKGGTEFDYMQKGDALHTLGLALDTGWLIKPIQRSYTKSTQTTVNTYGELTNSLALIPSWKLDYNPEGRFSFKVGANIPVVFLFANEKDYDETITGSSTTKNYTVSRNYNFNLTFSPELAGAMTFRPTWKHLSKFAFNFGASFAVPTFGWETVKTETRNASTGNVTATTTDVTWKFNGNTGKFTANSGLTWFFNDKVTIDGNWNIAANLFSNSFRTGFAENNGTDDHEKVWANLNKLLVHNVGFLVSVKL